MFPRYIFGSLGIKSLPRAPKFVLFSRARGIFRPLLVFVMFAVIAANVAVASMPGALAQGPLGKTLGGGHAGGASHPLVAGALDSIASIARTHNHNHHDDDDDDNGGNSHRRDNSDDKHNNGDDNNDDDGERDSGGKRYRHHRGDDDNNNGNNNNAGDHDGDRGKRENGNNGVGNDDDDNGTRCNCIVMRLDDVQDYWVRDVQLALMDRLISDHVHTSTAIIMNDFGNDSAIVSKVRQGGDEGLFEYAIHGWDHVDYATLPLDKQKSTMERAEAKLVDVLGKDSGVFVTPYNNFDEDTLNAMDQVGMKIISSDDTDLLPAAPRESPLYPGVAHMPQTINFADQVGEVKVLRPLDELVSAVSADVRGKGYAVLTLHPQDFTQYNGTEVENKVNPAAMALLEQFIQSAREAGFSFAGFQRALDDNHPDLSTVPDKSKPYESVTAPVPGSSFPAGSKVIVMGKAFDDTGVKSVEVRMTNSSYLPAASTDNDFGSWTKIIPMPPTPGTTEIIAKATDVTGKQTWVYVPVKVTQRQ